MPGASVVRIALSRPIAKVKESLTAQEPAISLDPDDWQPMRAQGHALLDLMIDHLAGRRDAPLWLAAPQAVRDRYIEPLPRQPQPLDALIARFREEILPFGSGNTHPGFMGWVQGGGTAVGMLAEMLAVGLNANCGGRDHMPIVVEQQIACWVRTMLGFPESASGLFVTGTSQATLIAFWVALRSVVGERLWSHGLGSAATSLVGYAAETVHQCVPQAMALVGLGSDALRRIRTGSDGRMDQEALAAAIARDRAAGLQPFLLVGTAGSVDTGAIDDLHMLADMAAREALWLHVDAAYGALLTLSPKLAPLVTGIERVMSVAFDFHKWAQVPYDAGYIMVRDGALHRATFSSEAAYLARAPEGLAGGSYWPCDYGPDLSRGFRALKTWFTLLHYGTDQLGAVIEKCCALAQHLAARVRREPMLELLAPVSLNIVCFRVRGTDARNQALVTRLHQAGRVAPSTTRINGQLAIRAAIFNHRTQQQDVDRLVDDILHLSDETISHEPAKK